jgi:hypothetical protein
MRLEVETPEPPRTDISPEGTYSAARRAAENLPDKGSPQEMLALLKNPQKVGENVKDDELKWTGLDQLLRGDARLGSITRDEILAHLDSHEVQITSRDLGAVSEDRPEFEGLNWSDPEPDMDPDYISSRVDDAISEIERMTTDNELNFHPWQGVRDGLKEGGFTPEEIDELETFILEHNRLPTVGAGEPRGGNDIYDILTKQEEESYRADPYWQTWRTDEGYEISGADGSYTVHGPQGERVAWDVLDLDEAMRLADEDREEGIGGAAQELYESETLPRGSFEDYKVMTINLADVDQSPVITSSADFGKFDAGHFRDKHQLMHIRFNTRDIDGKKTLFIEEFQSDPGRGSALRVKRGAPATDLPFIGDTKKYVGLAIRRMLTYAAKTGFDQISWTTGKQQADRYNLAKHIDRIELSPGGNLRAYDKNGREQIIQTGVDDARLDELLGKEVADRLRAAEPNPPLDNAGIARLQDLNRKADDKNMLRPPEQRTHSGDNDLKMERNLTPEEYAEYLDLKTRFTTPPGRILENVDLETGGEFHKRLYDKTVANELRAAIKTLKMGKKKAKITQGNVEHFATTLGAQGPRTLRARAERLRANPQSLEGVQLHLPSRIADALDMIADLAELRPDANLDDLLRENPLTSLETARVQELKAKAGDAEAARPPEQRTRDAADLMWRNLSPEEHAEYLQLRLRDSLLEIPGMVEANIPEYTSPAKRAEGIVHTFAIDAATRDKILKKGLPLFPAIAAGVVAGEADEPTRQPAEGRNNGAL